MATYRSPDPLSDGRADMEVTGHRDRPTVKLSYQPGTYLTVDRT